MTATTLMVAAGIALLPVIIGVLSNWIGNRPSRFPTNLVWLSLFVAAAVLVGLSLYQQGAFGHVHKSTMAISGGGGVPTAPPTLLATKSVHSKPRGRHQSAPAMRIAVTSFPATPPSTPSPGPVPPPSGAPASSPGYTWSGPPSVTVTPDSFENMGNIVNLTVHVQASANAAVEGETVGLDVPVSPPDCPKLKPDPCDIQFSGGQYGGTDENGMMTFTIPWYPGDACNYSGSGNEFTYPKGTFSYSIDIQDTATGLVSSVIITVTNGPDTPAATSSC